MENMSKPMMVIRTIYLYLHIHSNIKKYADIKTLDVKTAHVLNLLKPLVKALSQTLLNKN